MPQTDGQIESKQLGTSSVNSRVIDDLRSSNYNGSKTDPGSDSGTQGWQVLKSGIIVLNQAIIRGTLAAAKILSGTLNIGTGGSLTVGGDVETGVAPITILDEAKLRFNRTDGTRILEVTPAGGMKLYAANGTTVLATFDGSGIQVGSDVVIDSTGLHVDGGLIQGVWFASAEDDATNVSLTTTQQEVCSLVIDPPAWVEQLTLFGIVRATLSNTSGGTVSFSTRITLDDGGSGEDDASGGISVANNETSQFTIPEELTVTLSPAGRTVTVTQDGWLSSGTNGTNLFTLKVLAFGVRSSFV